MRLLLITAAARRAGTAARHRPTPSQTFASAATPPRNPAFSRLTDGDVAALRAAAGGDPAAAVTDPTQLTRYSTDWTGAYAAQSSTLAVRPSTTAQAAAVLAHCHARRLAVVPQGGNTGLVGGGVPVHDEVVLSTDRMNKVLGVDAVSEGWRWWVRVREEES